MLSEETNDELIQKISEIKGMAKKSAEAFVEKIDDFTDFMEDAGLEDKLYEGLNEDSKEKDSVKTDKEHPLFGKSIVMTGFRDASIQESLKKIGAKLTTSVSKNTFIVLVKDKNYDTGKILEARNLGITLMTPNEFKEKFGIF